ncbi:Cof-type HAD-IIB family hydrolase [Granulibacter bethesdensis]|uniref:Cof-type HAD-IIB family hydrolase n=1 Tax=Granulibacter bethesdensis TaxID=364410 RepID=UPI0003F1EFE3|nr:Cof-type HAD-IIB family hydrolase [Granulibacter bethesdensis]AHJ69428.1 Hydrolase (HAD superfamily) [Granulibacter bethesdensis]
MSQNMRLVLSDVDNTLVTKQKVLTPRAIKAVQALRDKGIKFAVTSGRPPIGMRMLFEPLTLDTPIAGFNGGMITDTALHPILARTLNPNAAKQAVEMLEEAGLDIWVYTEKQWYLRNPDAAHVEREAWTTQSDPAVTDDLFSLLNDTVKIVGVSDDGERVKKAERHIKTTLGNQASVNRSQPYYLDITHPDANKGGVVRYLAEYYGLEPAQIAVIGDSANDVEMFTVAGFSIAMGQADDEVKAEASAVTSSVEDEGFAKAMEEHFLS